MHPSFAAFSLQSRGGSGRPGVARGVASCRTCAQLFSVGQFFCQLALAAFIRGCPLPPRCTTLHARLLLGVPVSPAAVAAALPCPVGHVCVMPPSTAALGSGAATPGPSPAPSLSSPAPGASPATSSDGGSASGSAGEDVVLPGYLSRARRAALAATLKRLNSPETQEAAAVELTVFVTEGLKVCQPRHSCLPARPPAGSWGAAG